MGGRGSGGSRGGGGAAKKVPTGEGITDKNELINLYNSISGNSNLSVEQRVKAMHDIQERIKELDAKKASDLKQKRLDALAKARAKRAENKKNGIKPEKKEKDPRRTKAKMSMDSTVSDLKYNLRRGVESDGYISNSDFRVEDYGNSVSVQIRYLGKWKNPSHKEEIEKEIGHLEWDSKENNKSSKIRKIFEIDINNSDNHKCAIAC